MSQLQGLGGSSGGSGTVAAGTINTIAKYTAGTTVGNTSITEASAGALATTAGVALGLTATAPAATIGASQVGKAVSLTSSAAVASTDTAGAAAGGAVTITSGNAARNTSGNAAGGDFLFMAGSGIGTGRAGQIQAPVGNGTTVPGIAFAGDASTGFAYTSSIIMVDTGGVVGLRIGATESYLPSGGQFGIASGTASATAKDVGLARLAAGVWKTTDGGAGSGWMQQAAARSRVNGDVTNATNTIANITGLSATLIAGRKYTGEMVLKCSNSTAAEGIAVDFDGGNATMTSFAAGAGVLTGGLTVAVTTVSSALATDFDWSTITGETWITFKFTMVVNAAGTFIPRFRESTAHTTGTATVSLGSYLWLEDTP